MTRLLLDDSDNVIRYAINTHKLSKIQSGSTSSYSVANKAQMAKGYRKMNKDHIYTVHSYAWTVPGV